MQLNAPSYQVFARLHRLVERVPLQNGLEVVRALSARQHVREVRKKRRIMLAILGTDN